MWQAKVIHLETGIVFWVMRWWSQSVWELLNHGLNLWLTTWGKHWVSHGSTGEGNSAVWPEGMEPGSTTPTPHLRADCHWGRISLSRLLLVEFLVSLQHWWAFFLFISDYLFQYDNLSSYMPLKDQPNFSVYLLIMHPLSQVPPFSFYFLLFLKCWLKAFKLLVLQGGYKCILDCQSGSRNLIPKLEPFLRKNLDSLFCRYMEKCSPFFFFFLRLWKVTSKTDCALFYHVYTEVGIITSGK